MSKETGSAISYHYPQGTHLGHILSILKVFGSGAREGTQFDNKYIRLRGDLGEDRISNYRRQIKYKLQAAMELGIITDDRNYSSYDENPLSLTPLGQELREALSPVLNAMDLDFPRGEDGIPSTRMATDESTFNEAIKRLVEEESAAKKSVYGVFLNMHAVKQMLAFLYHICRSKEVRRNDIYEQFFEAPFVKQHCDQEGIPPTTLDASRRRCPFLLNVLDACGIINAQRSLIQVSKLVLMPYLVKPYQREEREYSVARLKAVVAAFPTSPEKLDSEDLSIVRELFGPTFLTDDYYLSDMEVLEE